MSTTKAKLLLFWDLTWTSFEDLSHAFENYASVVISYPAQFNSVSTMVPRRLLRYYRNIEHIPHFILQQVVVRCSQYVTYQPQVFFHLSTIPFNL